MSGIATIPSLLCRVDDLTSDEGLKINGTVGRVSLTNLTGADARYPVCLDGYRGPRSIKATNIQMFSKEQESREVVVAVGRRQFFDKVFSSVLVQNSKVLECTTMNGVCARSRGNLEAMDVFVQGHLQHQLCDQPVLIKLTDLNLAKAFNRAAQGEHVQLASPLNKKFQQVVHNFRKIVSETGPTNVVVSYGPHRVVQDQFQVGQDQLGPQRYEAAKMGSYQIYPCCQKDHLDALEVRYVDTSGKVIKEVTIHHEIYLDYGVEEALAYVNNAVALKESERLAPTVLAEVDPQAFWSALLWLPYFTKAMYDLIVAPEIIAEWAPFEYARIKSKKYFEASMKVSSFHVFHRHVRGVGEHWGIKNNDLSGHVNIATDYAICALEAVRLSVRRAPYVTLKCIHTLSQFKETDIDHYAKDGKKNYRRSNKVAKNSLLSSKNDRVLVIPSKSIKSIGSGTNNTSDAVKAKSELIHPSKSRAVALCNDPVKSPSTKPPDQIEEKMHPQVSQRRKDGLVIYNGENTRQSSPPNHGALVAYNNNKRRTARSTSWSSDDSPKPETSHHHPVKFCENCGRRSKHSLMACPQCENARYCNERCMKEHASRHRCTKQTSHSMAVVPVKYYAQHKHHALPAPVMLSSAPPAA